VWRASKGDRRYQYYDAYREEYAEGIPPDTTRNALRGLLNHASTHVPYYRDVIARCGGVADPLDTLHRMPLLSKHVIRREGERLHSDDLSSRKWYYNTSGGSTGEPVRLIQDSVYDAQTEAVAQLHLHLVGRDFGQPQVLLWGSERDILQGGQGLSAHIRAMVSNTTTFNAFMMTPRIMLDSLDRLNRRPPRLILAYAQAAYEVAVFAERQGIAVRPQQAIMTSADTLYPFMRETIERVFGCRVFNRYGSREVGQIACEVPDGEGLWVDPWTMYVEVLGEDGGSVSEGGEGEIVVTVLTNFAMPLIRYRIGDRGALAPAGTGWQGDVAQVLSRVVGRTGDGFRLPDGTWIDGGYFMALLLSRDWVSAFQWVQKDHACVVVRVVRNAPTPAGAEDEIAQGVRAVMGESCRVEFEYCEEITPSASGKYRYVISEVD
jgi:phenylacetate-CoA ligase